MAEGAGYCSRERRQAHSPPDSACGQEIWTLQKIQISFPWGTCGLADTVPLGLYMPGDSRRLPLERRKRSQSPCLCLSEVPLTVSGIVSGNYVRLWCIACASRDYLPIRIRDVRLPAVDSVHIEPRRHLVG